MTITYFPFDSGAGSSITESQWQQLMRNVLATGVVFVNQEVAPLSNLLVFGDSSGRQVKMNTGMAFIQGMACRNDALLTIPLAVADPTLPRIDRILLRLDTGANTITQIVLTGTPNATPVAPTLTRTSAQYDISLAQVAVAAAATIIAASNVTDERGNPAVCGWAAGPIAPSDWRQSYLVNPGLEIWQRGTGPFTASGVYTADRWYILLGTSSTISVSRDSTNADAGSKYCAAITYTHTNPSQFIQSKMEPILDQGLGRTYTLTVRVKCATPNAVRPYINTTPGGFVYGGYHTGNGVYQTLTVTATVPTNATYVECGLDFEASCTAYLDNTALIEGVFPMQYAPRPYHEEMAMCFRYYERLGEALSGTFGLYRRYNAAAAGSDSVSYAYKARKAIAPTVTKVGTWTVTNAGQPTSDALVSQDFLSFTVAASAAGTTEAYVAAAGQYFESSASL